MSSFLATFLEVGILTIPWWVLEWWLDQRLKRRSDSTCELKAKNFNQTPIGRSTKHKVFLHHNNQLRNNQSVPCIDRRYTLKRNHTY